MNLKHYVSTCCGAELKVVGGDEGTNHYECFECHKACDFEENPDICPDCGQLPEEGACWYCKQD